MAFPLLLPLPAVRALWRKELDQHRRVLLALNGADEKKLPPAGVLWLEMEETN